MRDERWGGVVERITDHQDLQSWCSGPIHARNTLQAYQRNKTTIRERYLPASRVRWGQLIDSDTCACRRRERRDARRAAPDSHQALLAVSQATNEVWRRRPI